MDAPELTKLLTRKGELEGLLDGFEKWLIAFGILVAIGVVGESVYGFRTWWNNRKLHSVQQSIDEFRQAEAARFNKEAGDARKEAGQARKDAETARKDGEQLKADNLVLQADVLKLQEKLVDRRLSPDQRIKVRDKMHSLLIPQAWQVVMFAGDGEARGLTADLSEALKAAGWPTPSTILDQTSAPIFGIVVEYGPRADTATQSAAAALVDILKAERLAEVVGPRPFAPLPPMQTGGGSVSVFIGGRANPNAPITVVVGRKP